MVSVMTREPNRICSRASLFFLKKKKPIRYVPNHRRPSLGTDRFLSSHERNENGLPPIEIVCPVLRTVMAVNRVRMFRLQRNILWRWALHLCPRSRTDLGSSELWDKETDNHERMFQIARNVTLFCNWEHFPGNCLVLIFGSSTTVKVVGGLRDPRCWSVMQSGRRSVWAKITSHFHLQYFVW